MAMDTIEDPLPAGTPDPEPRRPRLERLEPEERATPVMVYTADSLSWGRIITKGALRANMVLHSGIVPDFLTLYEAKSMSLRNLATLQSEPYAELHIPTDQVVGYHLVPPNSEPLDYDPEAPNRKMEPAAVIVGPFRFNGAFRMAELSNLDRFLEISQTPFLSMYQVEITLPANPRLKPMQVNFAQIRRTAVRFSPS